jgi:mannose-1-phosphate guanylyltransferase
MVTKVEDPSKFGVVVRREGSQLVEKFVEKPTVFVGDEINAGIYVFNPSILKRIKVRTIIH